MNKLPSSLTKPDRMTDINPEFEYVTGQMRTSFGRLLAEFEQRNAQALAQPGWDLDVPYGTHPRQLFDVRPTDLAPQGTMIYFHAGYWWRELGSDSN